MRDSGSSHLKSRIFTVLRTLNSDFIDGILSLGRMVFQMLDERKHHLVKRILVESLFEIGKGDFHLLHRAITYICRHVLRW